GRSSARLPLKVFLVRCRIRPIIDLLSYSNQFEASFFALETLRSIGQSALLIYAMCSTVLLHPESLFEHDKIHPLSRKVPFLMLIFLDTFRLNRCRFHRCAEGHFSVGC